MILLNQEKFYSYNIIEYDVVDSTMNVVKNFLPNTVVIARKQEKGRGKGNRVWNSENNDNLYFSLLIKADKIKLDYSQLSFVVSIAMRRAIKTFDRKNNNVVSKWPNDILINEKKVCGILLEFDYSTKNLVIGCGVNVDSSPVSAIFKATSLKSEGILVDRYEVLKEFLNNFDLLVKIWESEGFAPIRDLWIEHCYRLNEEIVVNEIKGIFTDIDTDGTLILKMENGELIYIKSGDVF